MSLHLTSCRHADLVAPESEIKETARLLERGNQDYPGHETKPVIVVEGSRQAIICAEALRRLIQ